MSKRDTDLLGLTWEEGSPKGKTKSSGHTENVTGAARRRRPA